MKNNAYSISERPNQHCAELSLSNLVSLGRHQMLCKFSTNPQYLVKPSRIQRQLIADKGSFDGDSAEMLTMNGYNLSVIETRRPREAVVNGRITFRAALPERRINVDRVSIRKGKSSKAEVLGRAPTRLIYVSRRQHRAVSFTNTDSYSRCFRYLDCFMKDALGNLTGGDLWQFMPGEVALPVCQRAPKPGARSNSPSFTQAVSIPSEYRGDNVPHSPYQPHSGSYPAGSCGQKVSSRALITALQASKGSGVERDEMIFLGQGLAYPDTT